MTRCVLSSFRSLLFESIVKTAITTLRKGSKSQCHSSSENPSRPSIWVISSSTSNFPTKHIGQTELSGTTKRELSGPLVDRAMVPCEYSLMVLWTISLLAQKLYCLFFLVVAANRRDHLIVLW